MLIHKKLKLPLFSRSLVTKSDTLPLTSSMLKIIIGGGESTREFSIHESLLTSRSMFFKKAMTKGSKEAEEKLVKLPEDDPDIFALYEQLVYTGCVPVFDDDPKRIVREFCAEDDDDPEEFGFCENKAVCQAEYNSLFKLYILVEKIQDNKAMDSTSGAISNKVKHECDKVDDPEFGPCLPGLPIIRMVYEKTLADGVFRQIFLSYYVAAKECDVIQKLRASDVPDIPLMFLLDLAQYSLSIRWN